MTDLPLSRLQAFSIFDKVAKAFMPPFFMPNVGMAVRAFGDDVKRGDNNIARHPHDFDLYHIGCFNDDDGSMHSFDGPKRTIIARASDYVLHADLNNVSPVNISELRSAK